MICGQTSCGRELPHNARYCCFCGQEINQKTDYIHPPNVQFLKIQLQQRTLTDYKNLPGLSGFANYLVAPDTRNHKFKIYNLIGQPITPQNPKNTSLEIENAMTPIEIGTSEYIEGGIENATTPIFDGIYFNSIKDRVLYRFGISRSGVVKSHQIQYQAGGTHDHPPEPIIIKTDVKRNLVIIKDSALYVIDITTASDTPQSVTRPLQAGVEWHQPVYIKERNQLAIATKSGNVYLADVEKLLTNAADSIQEKISHNGNRSISQPILLNNKLVFISKDAGNHFYLETFEITSQLHKQHKITSSIIKSFDLSSRLIYVNNHIFIIDQFNKQKALKIDLSGYEQEIMLEDGIDLNNYFLTAQNIFSFKTDKVHQINLLTGVLERTHSLSMMIGQVISPISKLFIFSGIMVIQERSTITLYKL